MPDVDIETILRVHLTERVGAATYQRLVEHLGQPERVFSAGPDELAQVPGIGPKTAHCIVKARKDVDVQAEIRAAERCGVRIMTFQDDGYPQSIKVLPNPPLVLYVKGDFDKSDVLGIALVGSRRASQYGVTQAKRLAAGLASVGATVISGMARGIDAAAHWSALRAQGRTIAVVGNGLGKVYPSEHAELSDAIAGNGAVVSELPMATAPARGNFPPRNRIISALSLGVVVVEAALRSGAMITARWANEQGKQVYAVPGPVDSPTSHGPHQLIKEGAKLVESCQDIFEELGPVSAASAEFADEPTEDARTLAMSSRERQIFDLLSSQPKSIDDIIVETGLPASVVSSTLLILEIKRCARQIGGQRYVRA